MPYCPQCLTEYVEGTSECEDCRIDLVPGSPPEAVDEADSPSSTTQAFGGWFRSLVGAGKEDEDEGPPVKTVRIRAFSGGTASLDAALARKLLQARGIPSVLGGETSAEVLPVLEVSLLVREEDADRAAEILRNYFDKPGPILAE
jgi:Putative prokaryotic signal transducing protein